ncbi:MAG: NAD(P)/FAD-dependent oxidoreductase [Tissierellia bacterium]|nr:NAD(P)/FAD-dependent oxidoreductase [Tissierellia bacterium]
MKKVKYLIIGNGIAGLSAAKEIRKKDANGSITMVSSEPYLTYYRLRLTECLYKECNEEEMLVNNKEWYEENNIEVILNKIVEKLDTKNNRIRLDDATEIQYGKLLIATGSRPFIPPVAGKYKQGVLALRTLKDLNYIKNYFRTKNNITVIGGGLLGLEAAWALKQLGKEVNIVEFAPYILPRQLDEELSNKLEDRLIEEGFNLYLNSQATEILGGIVANGIKLDDGSEIKTDAILFSVGIRPNLDLIRDTEIEFNKGVIVDKNLKTNIDNIYAAGDVIEVNGKIIGLWTSSNEQGKIAGKNMAGENLNYAEPSPYTSLQLGEIKLFSIGNINEYDEIYEYIWEEVHHKLFVKDNILSGAILFGDIKDMGKVKTGVENKMDIDKYLEDKPYYNKI